jgi:hypothetical protein
MLTRSFTLNLLPVVHLFEESCCMYYAFVSDIKERFGGRGTLRHFVVEVG